MGGKLKFFIVNIILLILFISLTLFIFQLHRFIFLAEFIGVVVLLLLAFISLIAAFSGKEWGWILLSLVLVLILLNAIFLNLRKGIGGKTYYLTILFASLGFLISIVHIKPKKVKRLIRIEQPEKPTYYVASKGGKTFHTMDCDWAKKIKEENKIMFNTKEEAKEKGYKPHSCVK